MIQRGLPAGSRGIGMTSHGTRDRLVNRLREKGIRDERVLAAILEKLSQSNPSAGEFTARRV